MGIVPPKLNFEPVREDAKKVITGAPFTDGPDSTLFADFKKTVSVLTAPPEVKERLIADPSAALTGPFKRGLDTMFAALDAIEPQATDNTDAWDLPRAPEYNETQLRNSTTTDLSAAHTPNTALHQADRHQ